MNSKRILSSGLLAGFVMAILDAITNAAIFGKAWEDAYVKLGLPAQNAGIPVFWTSFDLFMGVLIAWLYAAMIPRFGTGAKTAIYAALVQWIICHLTLFSHVVDKVFPPAPLVGASVGELVSVVVGALIIAKLYRDT